MDRSEVQALLDTSLAEKAALDARWAEIGQEIQTLEARLRVLKDQREEISGVGWLAKGSLILANQKVSDARVALKALNEGVTVIRIRPKSTPEWRLCQLKKNNKNCALVEYGWSKIQLPSGEYEIHPDDVPLIKILNQDRIPKTKTKKETTP